MKRITDAEMLERMERNLANHETASTLKTVLKLKGYMYTISFYGVLRNTETGHREYRRIEVFLNDFPKQCDVMGIKHFLTEMPPFKYYTIFAYNTETKKLILIMGW